MAEKRMVNDDVGEDRISDLPIDLINYILVFENQREQVYCQKSGGTSGLVIPNLCLTSNFLTRGWSPSKFVKTINDILLGRTILELINLYIPFSQCPYMDLWILFLSRNGIKELTLDNAYSQPSHIFSCAKLTYLKLCNCIISNPPVAFDGFFFRKSLITSLFWNTNLWSPCPQNFGFT